jgi:uracil-DNA glycosylase family 4
MTWEFTCPKCGVDNVVIPSGPKNSPVLILGDEPGKEELLKGLPFIGATGAILQKELAYLGVDLKRIRLANMWGHANNGKPECAEYWVTKAIQEGSTRKVILLVGSATVKYFCDCSVEGYNGLIVDAPLFPDARVMASVQPAMAFHGAVGEVRFALKQFADLLKLEGIV